MSVNNPRAFLTSVAVAVVVLNAIPCRAAIYYVSTNSPADGPGKAWTNAFHSIPGAINAAGNGDTVLVTNGVYSQTGGFMAGATNVVCVIKGITLQSVNGPAVTTLDGGFINRCVYLCSSNAVVDGFTLTKGNADWNGDGFLIDSYGTIQNCRIIDNFGGGGTFNSGGTLLNSVVASHPGAGVWVNTDALIRGCTLYSNGWYGVYFNEGGTAENCTIARNGGGVSCYFGGIVRNSILYDNDIGMNIGNWYSSATGAIIFERNCTTPAVPGGVAGISGPPEFVNSDACDFRLLPGSPCINAGTNLGWMAGAKDLDDHDRILYGTTDIGAYEFKTNGLVCNLTADVTEGFNPLRVVLTAHVAGTNLNGLNYSWDLYNNGSNTVAGAAFSVLATNYNRYGTFSPKLTVTNSAGETAMIVKSWYLKVGPPNAYVFTGSISPTFPYTNWLTAATNLYDAVMAGVHGTVIWVTNGIYSLPYGCVSVTHGVTLKSIAGPAATIIDGSNVSPCISLKHMNAVLDGFTVTRGIGMMGSGISCVYGGTVKDCVVSNHTDTGIKLMHGGVVTNSTICGNSANVGGGIFCDVGGTVTDCLVSNNTAVMQAGGINVYHTGTVNKCTVVDNTADQSGGIEVNRGGTVSGCFIGRNVSANNGGGMSLWNGGFAVNCTSTLNRAGSVGGGIYFEYGGEAGMSAGTVNDCVIISNTAYQGGGVYFYQGGAVSNCTVQENSADSGGGVWCDTGGFVRNSIIISNIASGRGGGMRFFGGGFLEASTVIGNAGSNGGGSALRFDNGGGVATNCTIMHNVSTDGGGVIRFSGGGALYNCTISSNSSSEEAVFTDPSGAGTAVNCRIIGNVGGFGPGGCSYMKDCTIAQNQATNGSGGGLTLQSGYVAVGCMIVSNLASQGGGGSDCGGGSLLNCTIRWNQASWGGGVNCWGGNNRISGCTIRDNAATNGVGGGVVVGQGDELRDCDVSSNSAQNAGGIWFNQGGTASNCWIYGNAAQQSGGGAMCYSNGVLQGCTISGNRALDSGGGLAISQAGRAENCTIIGNTVSKQGGGGVSLYRGGVITNSVLTGNSAKWGGGAWCNEGGLVAACAIEGNSSIENGGGGVGGGVEFSFDGGMVQGCVIQSNSAVYGGGVDFNSGGMLLNCLVARNYASQAGGGANCNNGGTLENCTLTTNWTDGTGGGLTCSGGTILNTIIRNNQALNWDDWYSTDGTFSHCCTTPDPGGTGNIIDDPQFVDAANGDFRLATNSPCIDKGTNDVWMTSATDLDGKPRIIHDTVDMGAFEAILPSWDTDGDTIPDLWTWEHFGHLTGLADDLSRATDSADGTGLNNLYKYVADLDPTNPLSVFQITAILSLPQVRLVGFLGSSNRVYSLKWSTNLVSGSWINVPGQTNILGTGTLTPLFDTNSVSLRFYQVDVQAP